MVQANIKMTLPCGAVFEGAESKAFEFESEHKKCSPGKCVLKKGEKKEDKNKNDRTWV